MRTRRIALFLGALSLALAPAAAAFAKPVSTFDLELVWTDGPISGQLVVTTDGSNQATASLTQSGFGTITCDDGLWGTVNGTWTASGPVDDSTLVVDKKLSDVSWSGTVSVTYSFDQYCSGTGLVTSGSGSDLPALVEVSASSSTRIDRSRLDGNRILASTLDTAVVSFLGSSVTASGLLTETISNG